MWTCFPELKNQQWHFKAEDFSTSRQQSTTAEATTSTTSTTTPKPLTAVRNCQLEPLVEGSGCQRSLLLSLQSSVLRRGSLRG